MTSPGLDDGKHARPTRVAREYTGWACTAAPFASACDAVRFLRCNEPLSPNGMLHGAARSA
jgi:hypothetical protein